MEDINNTLLEKLNVNQWKNTETVIHWFKSIAQKSRCFFIPFDIIGFYPSITKQILEEVIVFAKKHTEIAEKDLRIIKNCRKSLLYCEDKAWKRDYGLLNSCTGNIKLCDCRKKDESPLNGQCLAQDIVYKCITSILMNPGKTYLGSAEGYFKKRYNNHTNSFRHNW